MQSEVGKVRKWKFFILWISFSFICFFFRYIIYAFSTVYLRIQWKLIFAIVILCYRLRVWEVILSDLNLHMCSFDGCSKRLRKEIDRLLSKGISKIYLKVTIETFSNFLLSWFKKFVTRSVFGEFQLTQMSLKFKSSCSNLKIRGTWEQNYVWLFYYFNFERSCGILTSKIPCTLLNKIINLNKNKTEMKKENLSHSFKKTTLVL